MIAGNCAFIGGWDRQIGVSWTSLFIRLCNWLLLLTPALTPFPLIGCLAFVLFFWHRLFVGLAIGTLAFGWLVLLLCLIWVDRHELSAVPLCLGLLVLAATASPSGFLSAPGTSFSPALLVLRGRVWECACLFMGAGLFRVLSRTLCGAARCAGAFPAPADAAFDLALWSGGGVRGRVYGHDGRGLIWAMSFSLTTRAAQHTHIKKQKGWNKHNKAWNDWWVDETEWINKKWITLEFFFASSYWRNLSLQLTF